MGSSPLTRGKSVIGCSVDRTPGLIPAHAGKIPTRRPSRSRDRAHPRSRGENRNYPNYRPRSLGSSPLTRGKCHGPRAPHQRGRLIPAHAGKMGVATTVGMSRPAHPRSRGENVVLRQLSGVTAGSSPLTRGKSARHFMLREAERLIPAHAGKIRHVKTCVKQRWAHPRSRGENFLLHLHA